MKLATGAVECLSRGAAHDDPDVTAVGPNGDLFEAGQMVTEGDAWTSDATRALLWQSRIINKTRIPHVPDVCRCESKPNLVLLSLPIMDRPAHAKGVNGCSNVLW